jgi:hypothetical protein
VRLFLLFTLILGCNDVRRRSNDPPDMQHPPPAGGQTCGNGAINGTEPCDRSAFAGGDRCADYNLGTGNVSCKGTCELDFSTCSFTNYCEANGLYENMACDNCELLGGVQDPECMTACASGDGKCGERFDELTGNYTCRRRGFIDTDCGMCGNGIVEESELCDANAFPQGSHRCEDWGYVGGELACKAGCTPDFAGCRAAQCGDNMIEGPETCEGTNLAGASCTGRGFAGGMVTCTSTCGVSYGACVAPGCNNGIVEPDRGEICDSTDLGGASCETLGYAGGTLACDGTCDHDASACVAPGCGNEIIEPPLEACEGTNLGGATCESLGFLAGNLSCSETSCTHDTSSCIVPGCGNEIIEAPAEQCEGTNHGGATCQSLGFLQGTLTCLSDCTFDTSACVMGGCGNGIIESPAEQCQGTNLAGNDCFTLGFTGGTLSCGGNCRFDTTQCAQPTCGDDIAQGNEECDGFDLGGASCTSLGFTGSNLGCSTACTYDLSGCAGCGNGVVTGLEACDGTGLFCSDVGLSGGSVACASDCLLDFSACSGDFCQANNFYGDGVCDPCHLLGGTVDTDCNTHCGQNGTCGSYWIGYFASYSCELSHGAHDPDCGCGNGTLQPEIVAGVIPELCDGSQFITGGNVCSGWGYSSGTVTCGSDCTPRFANCVP